MTEDTHKIDLDKYYFFNDYLSLWDEMNKPAIDDSLPIQFTDSANMMNLLAKSNKHFISVFNTKTQKVIFSTDNIKEVLGLKCSVEEYRNNPTYYWLTASPIKQSWYMMQLSLFFKNIAKKRLHNSAKMASMRWYHHNMVLGSGDSAHRVGIQGKALKILPNGTMLLQMSVMKEISSYIKDSGKWWAEFIINEEIVYSFHEDTPKIAEGTLLSERELEVLSMIKMGLDSKAISEKLFISPMTVDTHRKNMLQKSGCKDISSLIQVFDFGKLWTPEPTSDN